MHYPTQGMRSTLSSNSNASWVVPVRRKKLIARVPKLQEHVVYVAKRHDITISVVVAVSIRSGIVLSFDVDPSLALPVLTDVSHVAN